MSYLSNFRGLRNLRTVRDLHRLVKEKQPKLVFLMETKLQARRVEELKSRLDFQSVFTVDCVGRSGGLAHFWASNISVEIQNYSRCHINATIKLADNDQPWKITCFYGHPDVGKRLKSWNLLCHLNSFDPIPWLCLGDFNETLEDSEKWGGERKKNRRQMEGFGGSRFCGTQIHLVE